jgi:hypothetical protein
MIKLLPYLDALRQMETQFEFLHYALKKLLPERSRTDRNALKHVSPQDIIDARRIFRLLPESVFSQAENRYAGNFARS